MKISKTDTEIVDWLENHIEHLNPSMGAPSATRLSLVLNGGHFKLREMVELCTDESKSLEIFSE